VCDCIINVAHAKCSFTVLFDLMLNVDGFALDPGFSFCDAHDVMLNCNWPISNSSAVLQQMHCSTAQTTQICSFNNKMQIKIKDFTVARKQCQYDSTTVGWTTSLLLGASFESNPAWPLSASSSRSIQQRNVTQRSLLLSAKQQIFCRIKSS